jgi:hypothetical protein
MASNFQSSIIGQNADQGLVSNDQLYNTVMRGAFSTGDRHGNQTTSQWKRGGGPNDKVPQGYRVAQLDQFTPEQLKLFKQMFGHLGPDSYLGRLAAGDESYFDEIEAPALRQFSGLQGNIASKYSGMGSGGRRSSGFQNEMTAAGSNFAQELQANRQNLRRQAIEELMGFSNQLLNQRPTEKALVEKEVKQGNPYALAGINAGGQVLASAVKQPFA